ncbi:IclR family transcriptional regulator [Mumia sp. zg.B53]|uniref:IclR family transcriptional regulator n=1 Tax=unclassified Mumia TaxID=2621872 RepID=UPI001C6EB225|nr:MULTISPECIES: IclR family transcriptional regulator [unclassified Mumia]MBW9211049.1 IclR family transcriptional regulator [Mumia sp. zg.B21]MBW9215617.1 IclR family transcriptional regulator [Mumia sp. zg.B53]
MTRPVPAATATLRVLRFLSGQPVPLPASRIAAEIGLPRSSAYHLLAAMAEEDFVVHYPDDRTWGLGIGAWEVGLAFAQQEPLARLARVPLARLVDALGQSAHLAVLHGSDVLYVLEERARGRPSLVTDVGVRLPAHLTASGRAILATLARPQVRALYPDASAFVSRTDVGPRTPTQLRNLLGTTRRRGHATEDGEVTPGFRSVAVALTGPSVRAAVAVTWESAAEVSDGAVVTAVRATADTLDRRLHAR